MLVSQHQNVFGLPRKQVLLLISVESPSYLHVADHLSCVLLFLFLSRLPRLSMLSLKAAVAAEPSNLGFWPATLELVRLQLPRLQQLDLDMADTSDGGHCHIRTANISTHWEEPRNSPASL